MEEPPLTPEPKNQPIPGKIFREPGPQISKARRWLKEGSCGRQVKNILGLDRQEGNLNNFQWREAFG